jgi:cytidine deaminase
MSLRDKLINESKKVINKSYSPYSKFKVGAAISTSEGMIFTGCNIENISFGLTICAERVALFNAISNGYTKFNAIAISSSTDKPVFPCGACRQVLTEFNPNLEIYIYKEEKIYLLSELLPFSFDKI